MKLRLRRVWWPLAGCYVWQLFDSFGDPMDTIQRVAFEDICECAAVIWNNGLQIGLATQVVTLH